MSIWRRRRDGCTSSEVPNGSLFCVAFSPDTSQRAAAADPVIRCGVATDYRDQSGQLSRGDLGSRSALDGYRLYLRARITPRMTPNSPPRNPGTERGRSGRTLHRGTRNRISPGRLVVGHGLS